MTSPKYLMERLRRLLAVPTQLNQIQEALGRLEIAAARTTSGELPIRDREFKVYSQWGEDGIIDYLVSQVPIADTSFVEFGVESYTEANTLFLLKHRHWRGLVIDGSPTHIDVIRRSDTFWKYGLHADCSFVTRDNINDIIARNGFRGDLGLLSVDIDGNDYWVWEAIDVVRPRIVVCEYNSLFGPLAAISIPYRAEFFRPASNAPRCYYGASITALDHLARRKGYRLVAGNSAGNNAFFVRDDCLGDLRALTPAEAYVAADFREDRNAVGQIDDRMMRFAQRQAALCHLPAVDVTTGLESALSTWLVPDTAR